MSVKENIQKIIKGKTTQKQIEEDLGMANRTISSWEHGMPSVESLVAVADYLEVSTDLILGREVHSDPQETELLNKFRLLNAEQKDSIMILINGYIAQNPVKKDLKISSK